MKIEKLLPLDERLKEDELIWRLTLTVPSNVLAITRRFKASVARPIMQRSLAFGLEAACNRSVTAWGHGPTLNVFRFKPDCMFHM